MKKNIIGIRIIPIILISMDNAVDKENNKEFLIEGFLKI